MAAPMPRLEPVTGFAQLVELESLWEVVMVGLELTECNLAG